MQSIQHDGFTLSVACLRDNGEVIHLDREAAIRAVEDGNDLVWVNITVQDLPAGRAFLTDHMKFHELAVEDALSDIERPALQEFPDHLFMAASKITSMKNGDEQYTEIGLFLKNSALVTVTRQPVPLLEAWFQRFERRPIPFSGAPAFLMHSIVDNVVDEYFVAIDALEDEVDALADDIYSGDTRQVANILKLKRRLLEMRRHVTPMRDILNGLLRHDVSQIPGSARVYFQDVYDHTLRIAEIADVNRDTLTSLLDVHLSTVSNNLNDVMKKMTVISTVLMSAALIAGIYGMNFKRMPELEWGFGYPMSIGLMILSGFGILAIFRWKRWI